MGVATLMILVCHAPHYMTLSSLASQALSFCSVGVDPPAQIFVILSVIQEHPETDQNKAPAVAVTDLQDSAVNLSVFVWVKDMAYGDQLGLRNTLREEVKKRLDAEGVEIPFPQMDVHIK